MVDSEKDNQPGDSSEKDDPPNRDVSSFRRHSMNYLDPKQISSETGYTDKKDWYLLILKELFDNAIDFLQANYKGSKNEKITVRIAVDTYKSLFHYKVTNTNPENIPVFDDLKDILNFEMRYGSKQNENKILMGTLGDAMKRIAAFGCVFVDADNQGMDSKTKDWDKPIIYRSNGNKERKVLVHVDNIKQKVIANITTEETKVNLPNRDTEIESVIPLIAEARTYRGFLYDVAEYCRKRAAFTTDISFDIEISDNRFEGVFPLKVDAIHPINPKWNNLSSVYYSTPKQFADRFRDVFDREKTTMYKVLKTFRETTQISRAKFLEDLGIDVDMSVEEFLQTYSDDYDKKTNALYYYLRDALPPATELSLPYYSPPEISRQMRKGALAQRIREVYDPLHEKYDPDRAVYKIVRGEHIDDKNGSLAIRYPYVVEIIAIPMKREYLYELDQKKITTKKCDFMGAINNSVSPKNTIFRDFGRYRYGYLTRQDDPNMEEIEGDDVQDVLAASGFPFPDFEVKPRTRIPSIIAVNLMSPKLEYIGTSKTDIDIGPFIEKLKEAVEAVASEKSIIRTYKGVGIKISPKGKVVDVNEKPDEKQDTFVTDVIEMLPLIKHRLDLVKEAKALNRILPVFDERTRDSIWYNCLPLWGKKEYGNVPKPTRERFKEAFEEMCERNNVTREEIGVIASPWAAMYFEGIWRLVSYDAITELSRKGVTLIFIEKRDIVQSLGPYASRYGVALVNSRGFLVEYAIRLAEAAEKSGAHIAIMTDYDVAGIIIASKLSNAIWLGCDERMLRRFDITHNNENYAVDYDASVARTNEEDLQFLLHIDKRFAHVDIDFIREKRDDDLIIEGKRVELDAVLARASEEEYGGSPEALWNYMMELLQEAHPIQDYTRVIDSKSSTLYNYYPKPFRQLATLLEQHVDEILEPTTEEIGTDLENTEGFIDVEKKREEIDKLEGKIIEDDPLMNKIGNVLQEVDQQHDFGIIKMEPKPLSLSSELIKMEKGVKKIEVKPETNRHVGSAEIPDPPITDYARELSKIGGSSNRMTPLDWAKYLVIKKHGSEEIKEKIRDGSIGCCCKMQLAYKEVMLQFKQQHNQRLPWQPVSPQ